MYATDLFTFIDNVSIAKGNEVSSEATVSETYLPTGAKVVGILSQSVRNASSSGGLSSQCNLYDLRINGDRKISYQCFNFGTGTARIRIQLKLLYSY